MSDSDIPSSLPLDYESSNETNQDQSNNSDDGDLTIENLVITAAMIAIHSMHIFCNRVDDVTDGIHELNETEIYDEIRIAAIFRMDQVCFYLNALTLCLDKLNLLIVLIRNIIYCR